MSRKLPGSAIVPGTITVTQITGGLNDTTNASYAQANTARTTANDAYGQANTARDQANTARTQANTAYGQANNAYSSANLAYTQANSARSDVNTTFATVNTTFATLNTSAGTQNTNIGLAYDQANAARGQANTAYGQANAAYGAANTRLSASGGTLSGDLIITGNLTVSGNSTTLNTEVLTVEDAEVVLLSNVASTPALNAGVIVNRGTSTNTFLRWNETLDEWGWSDSGNTTYYFEDLRQGLSTTNTTFGTINTSLGTINTSYQAAYAQANTAGTNALNAYGQANTARTTANDAYGQANTARNTANSAYGQANTATTNAGNAYDTANSAYTASNRLITQDLRTIAPNSHTAGRLTFGFTSYTNNGNASSYADYLHFRSYTDSSGGSDNLVMFHKSGIGMRIWQQTWNSSTAYSNYVDVLHSSNYSSYAVPLSGGTMTGALVVQTDGGNEQFKIVRSSNTNKQLLFGFHSSDYGTIQAVEQNVAYRPLALNPNGGNVGIGTTSPGVKLDVFAGDISIRASEGVNTRDSRFLRIFRGSLGADQAGVIFGTGPSTENWFIGHPYSGGGVFNALVISEKPVINDGNGVLQKTPLMYFTTGAGTAAGNVGIGTSNPTNKLDVIGNALIQGTQGFNATDETASLYIGDSASEIRAVYDRGLDFYQNGTHRMRIQGGTGNVGIGTTNPGQKLDVNGNVSVSGSGSFGSGVLCLKSSQSSANSDYLGDLDGYGGSSYDGYYAVGRPGYSSGVMQFNVAGSTGTVQFAFSYSAAMYRRNKTDNVTWSSWRQVD